jgi:hypothetical protein
MAAEVIIRTGDAQESARRLCLAFRPTDHDSVQMAIVSDGDILRHALFDGVTRPLGTRRLCAKRSTTSSPYSYAQRHRHVVGPVAYVPVPQSASDHFSAHWAEFG